MLLPANLSDFICWAVFVNKQQNKNVISFWNGTEHFHISFCCLLIIPSQLMRVKLNKLSRSNTGNQNSHTFITCDHFTNDFSSSNFSMIVQNFFFTFTCTKPFFFHMNSIYAHCALFAFTYYSTNFDKFNKRNQSE